MKFRGFIIFKSIKVTNKTYRSICNFQNHIIYDATYKAHEIQRELLVMVRNLMEVYEIIPAYNKAHEIQFKNEINFYNLQYFL
mgnify:FL=1